MGRPKSKGAYVPLAAQYFMDDAILEAGPEAELLFVRCLSFLASMPTDGFITERQVRTIVGLGLRNVTKRLATLQEVGVIAAVDGGFVVRSWTKWNKTAEEIGKTLAKDRERKAQKHAEKVPNSARNPDGNGTDSSDQSSTEQSSTGQKNTPSPGALERMFDEAYSQWPKKVERKEAFERFKRAAKTRDPQQLVADIVRFGRAYAVSTERRFVPALGVWLNGERWSDELPASPGAAPGGRVMTVEEIERRRSEVEARVG